MMGYMMVSKNVQYWYAIVTLRTNGNDTHYVKINERKGINKRRTCNKIAILAIMNLSSFDQTS